MAAAASRLSRSSLDTWAAHLWLIGNPETPGRTLAPRVRRLTLAAILAANAVGAAVVASFAVWALPKPPEVAGSDAVSVNLAVGAVFAGAAVGLGIFWGRRLLEGGPDGIRAWLEADTKPTPAQRLRVLRGPLRIMFVQAVLWGLATVTFAVLNTTYSGLLALGVGMTVALGGLTTSAAAYVLAELALRPVASRALAAGAVDRRHVPGIAMRWLLAWGLGTGAPGCRPGLGRSRRAQRRSDRREHARDHDRRTWSDRFGLRSACLGTRRVCDCPPDRLDPARP